MTNYYMKTFVTTITTALISAVPKVLLLMTCYLSLEASPLHADWWSDRWEEFEDGAAALDPTVESNRDRWLQAIGNIVLEPCAEPFKVWVASVNMVCTADSGFQGWTDNVKEAKHILVEKGFFSDADFHDVTVAWCEPLGIGADGMVPMPNRILLNRDFRHDSGSEIAPLLAHEMIHVQQIREKGMNTFACEYSLEIGDGQGCAHSLEKPAYQTGTQVSWVVPGDYSSPTCGLVPPPDSDGDGVEDNADACPNLIEGWIDTDGDEMCDGTCTSCDAFPTIPNGKAQLAEAKDFYHTIYGIEPSYEIQTVIENYFAHGDSLDMVKSKIELSTEERFRAVSRWASSNCYAGAFPNFEQANYGNGIVDGTILLRDSAVDHRDLSYVVLGNPLSPDERFRAVNTWAGQNGYAGAFPNFEQADPGTGIVFGVHLLKKEWAVHRDIPVVELGSPGTWEERIRAVNRWAADHGYYAGFPTFHQADYGNGVVYGAILIEDGAARHQDISRQTLKFDDPFSFNSGGGCTDEITDIYQLVYGSPPDSEELASALDKARNGFSYAAVKAEVVAQAIDDIYQDIYRRVPTATELAEAQAAFANGDSFDTILAKVQGRRDAALLLLSQYLMGGSSIRD